MPFRRVKIPVGLFHDTITGGGVGVKEEQRSTMISASCTNNMGQE